MASKESSDRTGHIVDVKIVDVEKRYKPGPKHYVYVIKVTWTNPTNLFIIYRRYAQFFDLQCKLLDLFVETPSESNDDTQTREIPFLPGKIILGRSQVRQIALERKDALNEYCQALIALPARISQSSPILEFFHPTSTDIQRPTESAPEEKKPLDKSALTISEPAKLANYRCLADFTASEKLEISLKRNNIVQVLQKHPNGWWFVQNGDQTGFVPGAYLEPSELKRGAREGKTIEKSISETYIVNTNFEGKGKDELSLEQGSFVTVIEKSLTGWWKIKFNNTIGQYPAIYLTPADGRRTPENVLDDSPSMMSKRQAANDSNDSDMEDDYHLDPSKASKPELYYAHTDFNDTAGDCLSFKRGDAIEIHDKHSNGWWFGRRMKGDASLSWVPAEFLQKEPITDKDGKKNILSSKPKIPSSKMPDKTPDSPINKQEKEKVSTSTIRKNFEIPRSTNTTDQFQIVKKQPPTETAGAQKNSATSILSAFRPVNNKQETATTTTAPKISSIVTTTPLRPVNDKQEITTVAKKFPIPTSTPTSSSFRPINDKKETTSAPKTSPFTGSNAFRPINDKKETTSASKPSPITGSNVFRPINDRNETTSASKPSPITGSSTFRPINDKKETTSAPKNSPITGSNAFRPINNKQETTSASKNFSVTSSTPLRPTNAKQEPTQKSVKDLVGKYNHK